MNCTTVRNIKYCIVKNVLMTGDNTSIEGNAIDGSLPRKITIKSRIGEQFVREIGQRSFVKCETITHVIIEEGITKINYDAFYLCQNIVSVIVPSTVSFIAQGGICPGLINNEFAASPGTLHVIIEGPSSLEMLGHCGIGKKETVIINYCSDRAPNLQLETFQEVRNVKIYAVKKFSIESHETTVSENACVRKTYCAKSVNNRVRFAIHINILLLTLLCST